MASLPVFVAATVDLVPELSEEDKVVVPHIDLTQDFGCGAMLGYDCAECASAAVSDIVAGR